MRVLWRSSNFLEGKHGIHVNPFNYTLLLNNPPGALPRSPCRLLTAEAPHAAPERRHPGEPAPPLSWAHLGRQSLAIQRLGAPILPGLIRFPLRGLGYLIAAND